MFCYYISIYIPDIRHQRLSNNTTGISTDDYSPGDLSSRGQGEGQAGQERDLGPDQVQDASIRQSRVPLQNVNRFS